jgi:uncharacterized protein
MSGRLPQSVQPERLAEIGAVLQGSVGLSSMARLAGLLHDTDGSAEVELAFGVDEQGIKYARGRIRAALHLICQRCLQPLTYPIDIEMALGIVRPEEAARLPENYEPLLLEDSAIDVTKTVEDELLLGMPIVPMHPIEECRVDRETIDTEEQGPRAEGGKRRPFAGLAELMKDRK